MAREIASVYTEAVRENLKQYAAWPIGEKMELGDYGTLQDGRFVRRGNLTRDFQIALTPAASGIDLFFEFKSSGVQETRVHAGGSGGQGPLTARASAKLSFARADSVYFRAIGLTHRCIENLSAVNKAVMQAFHDERWDGRDVFIHSLFESKGTSVIISIADSASIELEATAEGIRQIDLADASAGLFAKSEENVGLKVIATPGLVPLLNLSAVRPRNRWLALIGLGDKKVQPLLQGALSRQQTMPLSGDLIRSLEPDISPRVARDLGKEIGEVFHVVELP